MNDAFTPPPKHLTRPDLAGTFGMSASTHWLATGSAQAVLERGGNAFDAAVAAAFVLHIVEPHLNGPGGDLVAIFATAAAPDDPVVLAAQGPAPRGATIEHFRAEGLDLVPGAGALAAAVPGAVDGWLLLLRDHGTWPLADALAYAIDYAIGGHPLLGRVAVTVASVADLFREHWPTSAERWMPTGAIPAGGDLVYATEYGALLRDLAETSTKHTRTEGIDAARTLWRERVGEATERFFSTPHRHSDRESHRGVMTAHDVRAFEATYEAPVTAQFRGVTIAKADAWSAGPALLQVLNILEGFDDALLDTSTAVGAHTVLEALKLALADRDVWYGDGQNATIIQHLLSDEYAASRRTLITARASREVRAGSVPGFDTPPIPPLRETAGTDGGAGVGEPTVANAELNTAPTGETRGDTCHIDIVDRWGNMISATPSGGWLQSSPTVPGLGFCLGTRLQMTWLDERSPARLEPGKRPRTTLTPTIVLRDGHPILALGSPGGDQQDQWQLLLLLRVFVGDYTPQQAIDAPAMHTTSLPGSFWPRTWTPAGAVVEDRLGDAVIDELERRGHVVTRAGEWALGRLSAVTRDPASGVLGAAANSRGAQGYATGR